MQADRNKQADADFVDIKEELIFEESDDQESKPEFHDVPKPTLVSEDDLFTTYPHDIPQCWSQTQCNNFKLVNRWLLVKNGKLGCKACMNVQNSLRFDNFNVAFEKGTRKPTLGWRTCQISFSGRTLENQQSSLRKKMFEHRNSKAHIQAVMLDENMSQRLQQAETSDEPEHKTDTSCLARIFDSVHQIVTRNQPFAQFHNTCSSSFFQNVSGTSLHAEKLFNSILTHMACELRKFTVNKLLSRADKITVFVYETALLGKRTTIALHLKADDENPDDTKPPASSSRQRAVFFDFLPLISGSSEEIVVSLLNCLQKYFAEDYLRQNSISFQLERKSQLLGVSSDLAETLIRHTNPDIFIYYDFETALVDRLKTLANDVKNAVNFKDAFKTCTMADAIFVSQFGPHAKHFDTTEMVNSWLTKADGTSWPRSFLRTRTPKTDKKISNDMALAAETNDEQRLVIDLKADPNSQEADDVDDASTSHAAADVRSIVDVDFDQNAISENTSATCGATPAKRKKRPWSQTDKPGLDLDDDAIEKIVQRVRETSDLYAITEDKDRLFLLSLLPFMKQLNSRENLEFRTEVQQLLRKKLPAAAIPAAAANGDRNFVV